MRFEYIIMFQDTEEQNKYQVLFFAIVAEAEVTITNEVLRKAKQTSFIYIYRNNIHTKRKRNFQSITLSSTVWSSSH